MISAFILIINLLYGYDFDAEFKNTIPSIENETIAKNDSYFPLEETIDKDSYFVGHGDGFYLNIVTSNKVINLNIFITPIGDVLIPVVGVINVDGLTINQAFSKIKEKCLETYIDSQISMTLTTIRTFKIKVLGPFPDAGIYNTTAISRVSDIYKDIILMNKSSKISRRNILLRRDNEDINIDLTRFYVTGEDNLNPFLKSGDILYFDINNDYVTVSGGVKKPGKYSYKKNETLADLIELCGGMNFKADSNNVKITRFISPNETKSILVSNKDFSNTIIQPQDFIGINIINDYKTHKIITLYGEVLHPGDYPIIQGVTTVKDIIRLAGGYTNYADSNKIILSGGKRLKGSSFGEQELSVDNIGSSKDEEYYDYIDKSFKVKGYDNERIVYSTNAMYTNKILDYKLFNGDIIEIPKINPFIEIVGAVKYPGQYPHNDSYSVEQYIANAGGVTERDTKDIYVIKAYTGQRINYRQINKIESGDVIYLVDKINYDKRTLRSDRTMVINTILSGISVLATMLVLLTTGG